MNRLPATPRQSINMMKVEIRSCGQSNNAANLEGQGLGNLPLMDVRISLALIIPHFDDFTQC